VTPLFRAPSRGLALAALLCLAAPCAAPIRAQATHGEERLPSLGAAEREEPLALGARPVSALPRLRVHVQAVGQDVPSFLSASPSLSRFSRLPVPRPGGLGSALSGAPFSGEIVWLALPLRNAGAREAWVVLGQGSGFRPSALILAAKDGSHTLLGDTAVAGHRVPTGLTDLSAYRIEAPPGRTATLYLRFKGGAPLGPGLSLWPEEVFLSSARRVRSLIDIILGLSLAACVACALLAWRPSVSLRGVEGRLLVRTFAFSALAALALILGRRGGGQSALLAGEGLVRYLATLVAGGAALALEAARARARGEPVAWRVFLGAGCALAALSPVSPATSFALPLAVGLLAWRAAVFDAYGLMSELRRVREESGRESARLALEADGARDFATATAAALRAPLAGLVGILEDLDAIVSERPGLPPAARSDLAFARAEAMRLDLLVCSILEYSGLGVAPLSLEDLDLAALARSAASLVRLALAGRGVRLSVDPPVLELRSDPGLAHRLLYTALGRAARAEGVRTVGVEARSDERFVALTILDDGTDTSSSDSLDLAVLSRLADRLGGRCEYRRDGSGGRCDITLPRRPEGASTRLLEDEALRVKARRGARDLGAARGDLPDPLASTPEWRGGAALGRVLVAGNEPVALLAMRRRLEAASWTVDVTVSASEALERALDRDAYDAVIIDSVMPDMSGFDFCRRLRRSQGGESLPVVLLTEAGRPDEAEAAFKAGASDYVSRPASGLELAARIKTHVELAASVRRELTQAARMAEFDKYRTLATLSAGVAHEINTPNNAVIRNVPILKEIWSALEPALERLERDEGGFYVRGFGYDDLRRDIPELLNDLYLGAQDIKRIVEGLKDYARSPSTVSSAVAVDVNEAIRYAVRLLKHAIAVGTERFSLDLEEGLPPVRIDRLKLTQVVINIVENAVQALPDGRGAVSVRSLAESGSEGHGRIRIEVSDEGRGIEPELLSAVFDPFFTTKRERGGTGLGLAVASGIVQEAGGSIHLRSEPGRGTTATVSLPAWREEEGGHGGYTRYGPDSR